MGVAQQRYTPQSLDMYQITAAGVFFPAMHITQVVVNIWLISTEQVSYYTCIIFTLYLGSLLSGSAADVLAVPTLLDIV